MTALDLDAIKARVTEATNGPWSVVDRPAKPEVAMVVRDYLFFGAQTEIVTVDIHREDAEFIAHARQDVPALVAEIERLRKWALEAKLALGAATVIGMRHGVALHYANHDRLVTEAERDFLPGLPRSSDSSSTGSQS